MDRVEVDCSNIFKAEQLGVAIGRARKKKGLRLIDFHPRNVTKPDKSLFKFNEQSSVDFLYDLECCEEEQHYAPISYCHIDHNCFKQVTNFNTQCWP